MNRRALLMILMSAACVPLLPDSAWAQQALTDAKKKQLRDALPYPEAGGEIKFAFSETDGVGFGTVTSENERENVNKEKNRALWERLRRATEPAQLEAKADFYAERGRAAIAVDKAAEGQKDRDIATRLYRDLAAKTDVAAKRADFLAKAAEAGRSGQGSEMERAVADAREAVRLAPSSPGAWKALGGVLAARSFDRLVTSDQKSEPSTNMQSTPIYLFFTALQNPAALRKVMQMPGFASTQADAKEAFAAYRKAFDLKPDAKGALSTCAFSLLFPLLFDAARMLPADASTAAFGEGLAKATRQSDVAIMLEKAVHLQVHPVDLMTMTFILLLGIGTFGQADPEAVLKNMLSSEKKLLEKVAQRCTAIRKDTTQDTQTRLSAVLAAILVQYLLRDEAGLDAALIEARELAPQDIRILELSVIAAGERKDFSASRRYAEALLRSRDIAYYHMLYARVLFHEGKPDADTQILASYRAALKREPENTRAAVGASVALMKLSATQPNRLQEAGLLLQKVAEATKATRSKEDTLALYRAAIVLYGLDNQLDKARTYLKQAQESFPEDDALKAMAKIIEA